MLLVAHALGLGASWVRAFEENKIQSLLEIPSKLRVVSLVTIGFPVSYDKYMKTEVIPYENVSWSEKYGKELSWVKKYGKQSRYKLKSVYGYSKELEHRISEKMKEKKVKESITEKLKNVFKKPKKK